jgi:hypothetical protein
MRLGFCLRRKKGMPTLSEKMDFQVEGIQCRS